PSTSIHTLSLHDALPICVRAPRREVPCAGLSSRVQRLAGRGGGARRRPGSVHPSLGGPPRVPRTVGLLHVAVPDHHEYRVRSRPDRKSTRLNSSHVASSY